MPRPQPRGLCLLPPVYGQEDHARSMSLGTWGGAAQDGMVTDTQWPGASGTAPQVHTHKRAPEKALTVIPSLPGLACALARGCWPQPSPPPVSGPPAAAMLAYREWALLRFLGCWATGSTQAAPSGL